MDNPYELDFFQEITDVHFGGQWFSIVASATVGDHGTSLSFDFPGMAGGTPGFNLIQSGSPVGPWYTLPLGGSHTVTNSDLHKQLTTAAGAHMTGFGYVMRSEVQVFLQLTALLMAQPFRIRARCTTSVSTPLAFVETIQKNALKAGIPVGSIVQPPTSPPIQSSKFKNFNRSGSADFIIDPATLQVTGPF
jgi:hypothetical protein